MTRTETQRMRLVDSIIMEMDQEAEITRRLLERVPEEKLGWRPHPKARSLGELAMHIGQLQGIAAAVAQPDSIEKPDFTPEEEATSVSQILDTFSESLEKAKSILDSTGDENAMAEWTLTRGGEPVMALPRIGVWRAFLLNHCYHHRGQLSAYLRELDVRLPPIYGPSADMNPFG